MVLETLGDEKLPREAQPASSLDEAVSDGSDRDLDDTYRVFQRTQELEASESEVKTTIRKIDVHVVPVLFMTYMLQYLDKNSLNFASVYGLSQGTNLHGQDYSWLGTSKLYYVARPANTPDCVLTNPACSQARSSTSDI